MFSYVFMKILESRPQRYDKGINLLSGGHAKKVREQIIEDFVQPNMNILDIGCGTGIFIEEAAKKGAKVSGVDISEEMLKVAHKRIDKSNLHNKISIHNIGIVEIDSFFEQGSFDLIVSTLVFSELYSEERTLALFEMKKLLKPKGKLVIAVEVRPKNIFKRFIHSLIRFPLSIITYIIAQTGTKAISGLKDEVLNSGFSILNEELSFLDSFVILSAQNNEKLKEQDIDLPKNIEIRKDISIIKTIWDFIGRWFPNPVEPGLRIIGKPDRNSLVILTSNFHLTVRRVEKSLKNEDVYLLVAPANGINVWCASEGGELNTHSVVTAIKTSRINDRVEHNKIILPQLSASGIDLKLLKEKTGRKGLFGPIYSKDIPEYITNPHSLFEHNKSRFSFLFRMEMLLSMNFIIWLFVAIVVSIISIKFFLPTTIYFWISGLIMYAAYPIIPGKSGWLKAGILTFIEILAIVIYAVFFKNKPVLEYWGMISILVVINLFLGLDLRGTVDGQKSEAEKLMYKLGMKSFGHIFSEKKQIDGIIKQNETKCTNCRICLMVCPKGVFDFDENKNVRIINENKCFECNACVKQCTENVLSFD